MSALAYERSFADVLGQHKLFTKTRPTESALVRAGAAPPFEVGLSNEGWAQWEVDFESLKAKQYAQHHHLRVHVWARRQAEQLEVAVAFGGTDPRNLFDWLSNLRWLIPFHDDEYTVVGKDFVAAFQAELRRRIQQAGISAHNVTVTSTGHSLGGGLAQQFAYAAKRHRSEMGVSKVVAFDPSPVTGFYSVAKRIRDDSRHGLWIDRPFECHEILSVLRALTALIVPPSARNPAIRGVRYDLLSTHNIVASHSITKLAAALYVAALKS
jgi:pimeloyl-ACP methyl ester carboxylesterase